MTYIIVNSTNKPLIGHDKFYEIEVEEVSIKLKKEIRRTKSDPCVIYIG